MTHQQKITHLTPKTCAQIKKDMLAACRGISKRHGLIIEDAGYQAMELGFYFEPVFRVSIPAADGTAYNPDKEMFEVLAKDYDLDPSDFGREFSTGHERFIITGIDPRRPKYPISVERLPDHRGFKFTVENIQIYLRAQNKS